MKSKMTRQDMIDLHIEMCNKALNTMKKKNHDYGGHDGDPFSNFRGSQALGVEPIIGILMRCMDKFKRIQTFIEAGTLLVKEESVTDAIEDVINYMILAAGMIKEQQLKEGENPEAQKQDIDPIKESILFGRGPFDVGISPIRKMYEAYSQDKERERVSELLKKGHDPIGIDPSSGRIMFSGLMPFPLEESLKREREKTLRNERTSEAKWATFTEEKMREKLDTMNKSFLNLWDLISKEPMTSEEFERAKIARVSSTVQDLILESIKNRIESTVKDRVKTAIDDWEKSNYNMLMYGINENGIPNEGPINEYKEKEIHPDNFKPLTITDENFVPIDENPIKPEGKSMFHHTFDFGKSEYTVKDESGETIRKEPLNNPVRAFSFEYNNPVDVVNVVDSYLDMLNIDNLYKYTPPGHFRNTLRDLLLGFHNHLQTGVGQKPKVKTEPDVNEQDSQELLALKLKHIIKTFKEGYCPMCHSIFVPKKQTEGVFHLKCPVCKFIVSREIQFEVLAQFKPVLEQDFKVFQEWKKGILKDWEKPN